MRHRFYKSLLLLSLFFTIPGKAQDTLIVGYTEAPPFLISQEGQLSGINAWLWKEVASELQIPYRLQSMSFKGMLDSLERGEIAVSINPLTITSDRSRTMEFTHSFYVSHATVAVAGKSGWQKITQATTAFFNMNFIKGLLVLLLIIFLFGIAGWYFERRRNPEHFRKGGKGLWDGFWWSAVTLTTVGYGDKAPKTAMGKISALVLMFGGMLFISGLTASIASSLTVDQLTNDPEGLEAFRKKEVGTVSNTGTQDYLQSRFFENVSAYSSVQEGLDQLKSGSIEAFIYDQPILKYRIQKDSTAQELELLPIEFDAQFYAFGITKDSAALEQRISQVILEIIERQQWQRLLNDYGLRQL